MTDAQGSPPELTLLKTLHHPSSGPQRTWQSTPHPDPSIPLLATASADKTVNVWSLRNYSLVSTITGGHKRSVRAVAWKDYGRAKGARKNRNPVVLGTGSFDANVGVWVWNDSRRTQQLTGADQEQRQGESDSNEIDITREADGEDDEEWHFSTLLTGPDSEIKSIEFSPPHYSANLLATSSRDKSVWVWEEVEPEEWETIAVLSEHTGDVKCVSWCAGAPRRKSKRRKVETGDNNGDVDMENGPQSNGASAGDDDEEAQIVGSRDVLASGSYDDTIRLWRDVEEEGDWICVGVIDSHNGTVWDVKWEGYINYSALDSAAQGEAVADFEADFNPRLLSCSDDLSVRVWRRELSEEEKAKRTQGRRPATAAPTGFASSRLPSVIRPPSSMETWVLDSVLPEVHVRSVYAVDWSRRTGLVVSCGGDGTIAVYKEVVAEKSDDVDMNGTSAAAEDTVQTYKTHKMKWVVVAQIEAAHDEFEVNHVCWGERRDREKRFEGEEVIVSTGDEGDVRIWTLPDGIVGE
ncbi:WD40-repeat-containing domain protein [Exophiala viscosa]|uniref:WD40-repeat-containing domain protein n=1 Tax=Exophiala viscosa TaxID=2486360 RepID=UPI00219AFD0C|nr:WD40-repeat-containing domain protein [Exophiala viscosa]